MKMKPFLLLLAVAVMSFFVSASVSTYSVDTGNSHGPDYIGASINMPYSTSYGSNMYNTGMMYDPYGNLINYYYRDGRYYGSNYGHYYRYYYYDRYDKYRSYYNHKYDDKDYYSKYKYDNKDSKYKHSWGY